MKPAGYTPQTARLRADLYSKVRSFFSARDVLEVETPVLGRSGSTDPHIDLFIAQYQPFANPAGAYPVFLQTSPELHMKRLLGRGFENIFQFSRVFRNGECTRSHNPEFMMLEWYRSGFSMQQLVKEITDLIQQLLGARQVCSLSYDEAVIAATSLNPFAVSVSEIAHYCTTHGYYPPSFDSLTDALQFLISVAVEKTFDPLALTVLHHFPSEQAVFAQLDRQDPKTALRFEIYSGGLELANGWEELADPAENRRRMEQDNHLRQSLGKAAVPLDESFLDSMGVDFPPCSGVALGFDRICMLAGGFSSIEDTLAFPWSTL